MILNFTQSRRAASVALSLSLGVIGLATAPKANAACADLATSPRSAEFIAFCVGLVSHPSAVPAGSGGRGQHNSGGER